MKPIEKVHIGHLIQDRLKQEGRSVIWFASQMSCSRSNMYKLFKRSSIDSAQLFRASKILGYNFFKHLSDRL